MSKFAPPAETGEKPYVVTVRFWADEDTHLEWAEDAAEARRRYPSLPYQYVTSCRRATPADIDALS